MSNEILSVLQFMEKEKGIDRNDMIQAITSAIKNAAQKGVNAGQELKIEIDPKTGALKAWALLNVVDSVSDSATEIHIEKARQIIEDIQIGEILEKEIDPAYLGRIAAQTARQAIMQRIRQFEKDRIYEDYKDSIGDIVTGVVRRRERGDLFIDLGKAEAILPIRERVRGEEYAPGERIRCLLLRIDSTPRGPELILSRSNVQFVKRLFELEVTEISDGTVFIQNVAREPGYRTKITVQSNDPKVDPVGACVGGRGARVKAIVRELGEKIDVIRYHEDPRKQLEEAIKPIVPMDITVDEQNHRIYFSVKEKELAPLLGHKGVNAKLTSILIGWPLDISKEKKNVDFKHRMRRATESIKEVIPKINNSQAEKLVNAGVTTPEAFEGITESDLQDLGFSDTEAKELIKQIQEFQKK